MASLYNHFETDFGGIQNSVALLHRKKNIEHSFTIENGKVFGRQWVNIRLESLQLFFNRKLIL